MLLNDFYIDLKEKIVFKDIKTNSKDVLPGDLYIAIKGNTYDGHHYISEAINQKAAFIISEVYITDNIPNLKVSSTKDELIRLINYYYPSPNLKVIGVTGTDGKTTTSMILYHLLNYNNNSSYIGTNGFYYHKGYKNTPNTTPDPLYLGKAFSYLIKHNHLTCSLEVSSEGICDSRIKGIDFHGGIFTNLSHEHLNKHKTMRNYFKVKESFFKALSKHNIAILNADDKHAMKIKTKAKIITFGIKNGMYQAKNINLFYDKSTFDLFYKNKYLSSFILPLMGEYNIYNALGAICYAIELKIPLIIIRKQLSSLIKISGRLEEYRINNKSVIIDFAHTPNGLENLLCNLVKIKKKKIILVMGCAGEKDFSKRHLMSRIACQYANIVIFTSEDPKNESLINIFSDMTNKLKYNNYYLCIDRKEAIKLACDISQPNDLIVITGKGNEQYEDIKGFKLRHNDLDEIKKNLK